MSVAAAAAATSGSAGGAANGAGAGVANTGGANGVAGAGSGAVPAGSSGVSAATPATAADWTSGLSDDHKGFIQNKGWKAPQDALESYQNYEKLIGIPQDQIIRMPKADDQAAWDSVYTRLGRPANPEAYKLETPKDGSADFSKWAASEFHKAGLNEKQAKSIHEAMNQAVIANRTKAKEASDAKAVADGAALKKEWGAAYEMQMGMAKQAAKNFGITPEVIGTIEQSAGYAATMKFFQQVGEKLGEPMTFHNGNGNSTRTTGPMTPAQAEQRQKTLLADPAYMDRYVNGGAQSKERQEIHWLSQMMKQD